MRGRFFLFIAGLLACLPGVPRVGAQFYAPDTEYHDRAQRHFVVELARVQAWRANRSGAQPPVAQITQNVSVADDRRVTWKIRWLDADGKPVREFEVGYPESALTGGAAWYRDVARQLACSPTAGAPGSGDDLIQNYWKGAENVSPSRADSLGAAFALTPEKDAAQLAGLLAHTSLPAMAGGVTLDAVLLARAAVWLCVAEQSIRTPDAKLDTLWAPILFLSGRENAAADLWKKAAPAPADGTVAKGWELLFSHPRSAEVFAFAADPRNRRWAMPLIAYETTMYRLGETLPGVTEKIFPDEKSLAALHDYGPYVSLAGVGAGQMMAAWPKVSRDAWVNCLRRFKPEAADFQGYIDALRQMKDGTKADERRPGLAGLAAAAPLLNLGFREGTGKLAPVAVVTARDLLNFGWEMNGLQLGRQWEFLANSLGVRDSADAYARTALGVLEGSECFFVDFPFGHLGHGTPATWQHVKLARLEGGARLQELDDEVGDAASARRAFDPDKGKNALLWVRRCWLRPSHVLNQGRELFFANQQKELTPLLRRLRAEGGPMISYQELTFFVYGLNRQGEDMTPGSDELRLDLLADQTEPSYDSYKAAWGKYDDLPPFEAAQALEKMFWQRPGSDLPYNDIFSRYLTAHAYDAARRFYRQAEGFVDSGVGFSNGLGPRRFTLAMMEKDQAAMREALRASGSGSFSDMVANVMADAARGDLKALTAQVDECLERYPPAPGVTDDMMHKLKEFLPLLPALKDPAHAEHARALDFFKTYAQWPTLQWVFLQNASLPVEEAVRFLGGKETNAERREMVAFLLKDKELFARAYEELEQDRQHGGKQWSNMAFVVVHYLRNELLDVPVPADQSDLKPPEARSLQQVVDAKVDGAAAPSVAEDLSKYTTADALWAHLGELRQGPSTKPTARAEVLAYLNSVIATAAEFSKHYPHDPRRWEAKLAGLQMSSLLAQVGGNEPDESAQEAVCREIADALDAPAEIRAEARFGLIQIHFADAAEGILTPAQEKEIVAFVRDFPSSPHAGELQLLRVRSLEQSDPAQAESLLTTLSKDPNPDVSLEAAGRIAMREVVKKPLEMRFTALDGSMVDAGKLRGKVVLIDFWATWCAPCMAEVPEIVETYKKLHDRGFEIVGISLDEDKGKVLGVTQARGMTWPQFFDGKGWGNEISSRYAIRIIPRMWLVDKKGMVVDTAVRGNLSEAVETLLGR